MHTTVISDQRDNEYVSFSYPMDKHMYILPYKRYRSK